MQRVNKRKLRLQGEPFNRVILIVFDSCIFPTKRKRKLAPVFPSKSNDLEGYTLMHENVVRKYEQL